MADIAGEKIISIQNEEFVICPYCEAKHAKVDSYFYRLHTVEMVCEKCGSQFKAEEIRNIMYVTRPLRANPSFELHKALISMGWTPPK